MDRVSLFAGLYGSYTNEPETMERTEDVAPDSERLFARIAVRNNTASTAQPLRIKYHVLLANGGWRWLHFWTKDGTDTFDATYQTHYLGPAANDGLWHELRFDLNALLQELEPAETALKVGRFHIDGKDLSIDTVALSDERETHYFHTDDLFNVVALTDAAGAELAASSVGNPSRFPPSFRYSHRRFNFAIKMYLHLKM